MYVREFRLRSFLSARDDATTLRRSWACVGSFYHSPSHETTLLSQIDHGLVFSHLGFHNSYLGLKQRSDEGDERCYSPPSRAQLSFACLGSAVTLMTFR